MYIRPELPSDEKPIRFLIERAFDNAPHSDGAESKIVDALRKADALAVSLVAEEDGVVVGHVAISPVAINDGSLGWYGLGPLSVEPSAQGRGIGSRLMQAGLGRLREHGAAGCVVLGEPSFYARFGFSAQHSLIYPGPPSEYFLAVSYGASKPRGQVSYHAAFASEV